LNCRLIIDKRKLNNMKLNKTFDIDQWGNIYTYKTEKNSYEIYRERTYKKNGTSKCDGNWIVEINNTIENSFKTLKEVKNFIQVNELF